MLGGHPESCAHAQPPDAPCVFSWSAILEGGMDVATLCKYLRGYPRTTDALHLASTCEESLDTVASRFITVRLTFTSAASPLAEQIILDPQ